MWRSTEEGCTQSSPKGSMMIRPWAMASLMERSERTILKVTIARSGVSLRARRSRPGEESLRKNLSTKVPQTDGEEEGAEGDHHRIDDVQVHVRGVGEG